MKHQVRSMLILVCLAWTGVAHAQIRSATLTGTVTDSQKAIVPGATVVVTNEGTNVSQELVTNDDPAMCAVRLRAAIAILDRAMPPRSQAGDDPTDRASDSLIVERIRELEEARRRVPTSNENADGPDTCQDWYETRR